MRKGPSPGPSRPKRGGSSSSLVKKDTDKAASDNAFRVAVRCRPLLRKERATQPESVLQLSAGAVTILKDTELDRLDGTTPRISPRRERQVSARSFTFDHVYDDKCPQERLYTEFVAPFTEKYLEGFNVTLFAYGQTGTGKTYTVIGEQGEERGVVPRFVEQAFDHVRSEREEADAEAEAYSERRMGEEEAAGAPRQLTQSRVERMSVCVFEVYEGKVFDLLSPEKLSATEARASAKGSSVMQQFGQQLQLEMEPTRPGVEGRSYWVKGNAGERTVTSAEAAIQLLRDSQKLRHTASHALNEASSRSHCIFSLATHRRRHAAKLVQLEGGEWGYGRLAPKGSESKTRANLVDLAGSEDARDTQA
jgi:hypothetical protein